MTVTGKTLGENLEEWTHKYGELDSTQDVIRPLDKPLKSSGHIRYAFICVLSHSISLIAIPVSILKGNLAPGGAVAKITGKEGLHFTGKARVFDNEEDFVHAVESGSIKKGEKTVVVLRYLGPKGGPGPFPLSSPSTLFSVYPAQPPHQMPLPPDLCPLFHTAPAKVQGY